VLAAEVGMSQPTLSRWVREAHTVPGMAKKSRRSKEKSRPQRPQDWSPEEKLRVVVESTGLTDEELGAFLLHQAQLDEWSATARSSLSARKGTKKASAESKRIRELERELRRKEKALAEAAALLILKKKAQAIWGDEDDDTEPRSGR
jgi:transposase-like protein